MNLERIVKKHGNHVLRCLIAVFAAAVSSISMSVFFYMRSSEGVEQYYSAKTSTLLHDAVSIRFVVLLLVLSALYAFILLKFGRPHVSSMVVSLFLSLNMVVSLSMEHSGLSKIFLPASAAVNVLVLIGFDLLITAFIELICFYYDRETNHRIEIQKTTLAACANMWFVSFFLILLCWAPFLYFCYPGSVMNDTRYQIMSWLGLRRIVAAHPVLTTVLYGGLYQWGISMGDESSAIFFTLSVQTTIVAAAMAGVSVCVYRYTGSKMWRRITTLFFGLLPVWQNASQLMLKDVLHAGLYLLFYIQYLKCLREKKMRVSSVVSLGLCAVLITFTRKAAFFLALLSMIVLAIVHFKRFLRPYLLCIVSFVCIYVLANQMIYPMLNIEEEWESENYSLQFQQVALYCREHEDEITYDEVEAINTVLDFDTIVRDYTPMLSDPVKATFHAQNQDMSAFWTVYFKMLRRDPLLFVKGTLMSTFEHMNPFFTGSNMRVYISHEEDFIKADFAHPDAQKNIWTYFNISQEIPVIGLLIGTGLYTWILLILLGYSVRKRSGMAVLGLFPSLALFFGLFMSHVNGEIRYGYPLIAATPLIFSWAMYCVSQKQPPRPALVTEASEPLETVENETAPERLAQKEAENAPPQANLSLVEVGEAAKSPSANAAPRQEELAVQREEGLAVGKVDLVAESKAPENPAPSEAIPAPETVKPGNNVLDMLLGLVQKWIPVPKRPLVHLDVLKIIAIYLVLFNHTGARGFLYFAGHLNMPWHALTMVFSIFDKVAVPLFFMTSGALLIGREESYEKLFFHRVLRYAGILVAASLVNYLAYVKGDSPFDLLDFIRRLYTNDVVVPLWYMYSYLSFLMMLPFIRMLARGMKEKDYFWLLISHLIMQIISVIDYLAFRGTNAHTTYLFFFTSYSYVVYGLCGFYIEKRLKAERLNEDRLFALILCSLVAIGLTFILTEWKCKSLNDWSDSGSQTFLSSFIIVPSLTLFYGMKLRFSQRPVSNRTAGVLSIVSSCTFGVYLFERTWRSAGSGVFNALAARIGDFPASLIQILCACLIGIAATLVWKMITGAVMKRIKTIMQKEISE